MECKKIILKDNLVEVRLFRKGEINTLTEQTTKDFFDKQKQEGYCLLKVFRDKEDIHTLFIKEKDIEKIICQK